MDSQSVSPPAANHRMAPVHHLAVPAAGSKGISGAGSFSEVINDGIVAVSSVALIGSFFWVRRLGCGVELRSRRMITSAR